LDCAKVSWLTVHCKACLIEAFELGAVDVMLRKKICWKKDWGSLGSEFGVVDVQSRSRRNCVTCFRVWTNGEDLLRCKWAAGAMCNSILSRIKQIKAGKQMKLNAEIHPSVEAFSHQKTV